MSGSDMKIARLSLMIAVIIAGCDGIVSYAPPAKPVKFDVYVAQETNNSGLVAVKHPDTGQDIYREAAPVLTNADVSSALVAHDQFGQPAVQLYLTDAAAQRFTAATEAHIGQPIVIALDGKVQMVATIHEPLHQILQVTGKFTETQADEIARGIMK